MDLVEELQKIIDTSNNIVFFGGAGVSCESGIPDFRSADGLYNQEYAYPPETILSHSFFMAETEEFYRFYRNKMLYPDAKPNEAHLTIARLEKKGKLSAVITQNIDGLHQAAGSNKVFELHGSVHHNYCMKCGRHYGLDAVLNSVGIPRCSCGGIIKPDVVLYEEPLDAYITEMAVAHVQAADCLIIGGTSLTVYPAAGFAEQYIGDRLVLINKSKTRMDSRAALVINEGIAKVLSQINV